ncbi:MAG: ImmA/IrrE family metallo-endopeptidase [Cyanobacteria bacterium P01_H01_bin.153]
MTSSPEDTEHKFHILTDDYLVGLLLAKQFRSLLESGSNWSASIVHEDPIQIINNPNHAGSRRESNLMHELAHVLLNHPMVEFSTVGEPLRKKQYENEATYLGGCLQIPR